MNYRHLVQAQVAVRKRRYRLRLVKVVIGRAVIARIVVGARIAPQVRCQRRRRIRRRNQHQPRLAQYRRSLHRRRRARSADHAHHTPVSHHRLRRRRAALRRAQRVQTRTHRHLVPLDRPVVLQRQRNRTLRRRSQLADARKHKCSPDLNILAGAHHYRPQRAPHHILRNARAAHKQRKHQNRPAQQPTAGPVCLQHVFTPWSEKPSINAALTARTGRQPADLQRRSSSNPCAAISECGPCRSRRTRHRRSRR